MFPCGRSLHLNRRILVLKPHLSTNIPACTACTMLRNRGFSSVRLSISPIWRVKVEASQSRTSDGTESDWISLSSSSVSTNRLTQREREKKQKERESEKKKRRWKSMSMKITQAQVIVCLMRSNNVGLPNSPPRVTTAITLIMLILGFLYSEQILIKIHVSNFQTISSLELNWRYNISVLFILNAYLLFPSCQ